MAALKKLQRDISLARSYEQWLAIASEIDLHNGACEWRADNESDLFHSSLLQNHIVQLQSALEAEDTAALMSLITESLYRHLSEISNPQLYQVALCGTKEVISRYLETVCTAIDYLSEADVPGVPIKEKLKKFEQAYHNYGRSALVLSGGAAFGIYHLGVVKALWQQQLLPNILSGSSMGSIVAAGICARSDEELDEFFKHPERIHRQALRKAPLKTAIKTGFIMDAGGLYEHILHNVGDVTFAEAYARSGRVLNITVSPTRANQKPRVLSHLTAPDVIIPHAALASCAIPGVFPPVSLRARNEKGDDIPYMETEKWIDGSVHSDVPLLRISRLHNVNHTIVSQANPHVLPFITHRNKRGLLPFTKRFISSVIHAQSTEVLEVARDLMQNSSWRPLIDKAYGMARQTYLGDINIHLPFHLPLYTKVAANPDLEGLLHYIHLGEQATWPRMAEIRDQTRVGLTLRNTVEKLRRKAAAQEG
jgi:NTE family protein